MNTRDILLHQSKIEATQDFLGHLNGNKWIFTKGLYGSGRSLLMATAFAQNQRPLMVVAPNKEEAQYIKSDLENLLPGQSIFFLPDSFVKAYRSDREHAMHVQERIETLNALRKNPRRVVVTYGSALAEHVVEKADLESNTFEISTGQNLDIDFLTEFLYDNGFEREDFVMEPGQFSIRGGILDLFSFAHEYPFRLELDGDIIDNIRAFDVNTQLSIKEMAHFSLVPKVSQQQIKHTPILSYFDSDALLYWIEPGLQFEELVKMWEFALQNYHQSKSDGIEYQGKHHKEVWLTPKEFQEMSDPFKKIQFWGDKPDAAHDTVSF